MNSYELQLDWQLSLKMGAGLISKPEAGMGYQIVSIILKNGMRYDQAVIESGFVTRIRNHKTIPFTEEEIAKIIVTHDKWDFTVEKPADSKP